MAQYDTFARFYDAVNGEPEERVAQILSFVSEFCPQARTVLELGCGTGAVLAGLGSGFKLTGVDLSSEMLTYARRRCPDARFIEADITTLSLDERFDVVICVYDTLNHLTSFEDWVSVFATVAHHLRTGGLFIFDLNTLGRLRDLSDSAPWVFDFDDNTLVMDVDFSDEPLARWNIRIFERQRDLTYQLHHETILELAVPLRHVRDALGENFTLIAETDTEGSLPTDASARALFVATPIAGSDDRRSSQLN